MVLRNETGRGQPRGSLTCPTPGYGNYTDIGPDARTDSDLINQNLPPGPAYYPATIESLTREVVQSVDASSRLQQAQAAIAAYNSQLETQDRYPNLLYHSQPTAGYPTTLHPATSQQPFSQHTGLTYHNHNQYFHGLSSNPYDPLGPNRFLASQTQPAPTTYVPIGDSERYTIRPAPGPVFTPTTGSPFTQFQTLFAEAPGFAFNQFSNPPEQRSATLSAATPYRDQSSDPSLIAALQAHKLSTPDSDPFSFQTPFSTDLTSQPLLGGQNFDAANCLPEIAYVAPQEQAINNWGFFTPENSQHLTNHVEQPQTHNNQADQQQSIEFNQVGALFDSPLDEGSVNNYTSYTVGQSGATALGQFGPPQDLDQLSTTTPYQLNLPLRIDQHRAASSYQLGTPTNYEFSHNPSPPQNPDPQGRPHTVDTLTADVQPSIEDHGNSGLPSAPVAKKRKRPAKGSAQPSAEEQLGLDPQDTPADKRPKRKRPAKGSAQPSAEEQLGLDPQDTPADKQPKRRRGRKTRQPVDYTPKQLQPNEAVDTADEQLGMNSVVSAVGPVSRNYTLPAPKKSGRKALAAKSPTCQEDKRKEQNRIAQRGFRDRKSQEAAENKAKCEQQAIEITTLKGEIARLTELQRTLEAASQTQNESLAEVTRQRDYWMDRANQQQSRFDSAVGMSGGEPMVKQDSSSSSNLSPGAMQLVQNQQEQSQSGGSTQNILSLRPSTNTGNEGGATAETSAPIARNCGDCTSRTCVCLNEWVNTEAEGDNNSRPAVSNVQQPYIDYATDLTAKYAKPAAASAPSPTLRSSTTTTAPQSMRPAPGTCDRCQTDPAQRAFCLGLANKRAENSSNDENGRPTKLPRIDNLFAAASASPGSGNNNTIPCRDVYPLYKRITSLAPPASPITQDTIRNAAHDLPTLDSGPKRQASALDVDYAEILATLKFGNQK